MFIPEEDVNRGTEQDTEQVLDISDAGDAFIAMLEGQGNSETLEAGEGTEEGADPIEESIDPSQLSDEIPDIPQEALEQPHITEDSLDNMKADIINELHSLVQQQQPEQEGDPETVEEEPEIDSEEFMERFAENPVQTIQELADSIADKKVAQQMNGLVEKLQPVLQQSELLSTRDRAIQAVSEFAQENADASNYFQEMAGYINERGLPKDSVDSFREAYLVAKNNELSANKPLDQYLSDESSIEQIIQNPAIRDKVIEKYLEEVASGGKPQVIGDGSPSAAPRAEINSLDEAGEALKKSLGK